jgi:hypothetical protein
MAIGWRGQYLRYREYFLNIVSLYKKRADLRAFTEVILSLSTVTIFLIFALKPTALTIIDLTKEIADKKKTVEALNLKINNLRTASGIMAQIENIIPDIDIAVSTSPNPGDFTKQVQGIAAKNNVSVQGLSIGQITLIGKETSTKKSSSDTKPLPENAKEMPVSISVRGDYPNLLAFIKDLENSRVSNKVDVLGISSSNTEGGRVIVAVISGRIPFLGE